MIPLRCLALLLLLPASLLAQTEPPKKQPPLTPAERKLQLQAFDEVWETIRDKHWDPKLGGLDWKALYREYRPQVEKAQTATEVRQVLRDMLGRLKQSHFAIIPAGAYRDLKGGTDRELVGNYVPGLDVRVVAGRVLVTSVDEGLGASRVGVKPGWEVLKIRDEELAPVLKRVQKTWKESKRLERELVRAVLNRLRGQNGEKLPVVFKDGKDEEVSQQIPCGLPRGKPSTFGNIPTTYVHFQRRTVDRDIQYFSLNAFFDPPQVMKAFEAAVKTKGAGFIIDLRGNPGGLGIMAVGMGNWFLSGDQYKLGTLYTRDSHIHFVLNPRVETRTGPLAILVDGLSGSTSEIMAGGLQDLKRARIFGTPTMGAALPSVFVRLPNGDGFQYAIANYISTGGQALEGRGVQPDEVVQLDRQALLQGRDPVLEAAVRWIRMQKK